MRPEQRFKDYLYAVRDVMRMPKRMSPDVEESIGVCVAFDDLHAANAQIPLDAWMIRLRVEENRFEAAVQYPGDLYFQNTIWLICHQIQALLIQCLQHPDSPSGNCLHRPNGRKTELCHGIEPRLHTMREAVCYAVFSVKWAAIPKIER